MEVRYSGHGVYRTEYHVIWIPKYRHRILNPGLVGYLRKLFPQILEEMPGVATVELNMLNGHIHWVTVIPPKYAVCDVVARVKAKTSSILRKKFSWLEKVYWKENLVWSPGYFVSTIASTKPQYLDT